MSTVNGFRNHETWMIGLWLDNDPVTQLEVRGMCANSALYKASQKLEQFVEERVLTDGLNLWQSDLIAWALSEVSWRQLAEHFKAE